MKRPNLFIVGAMKSGSTTLHDYLAEHPEIFMSAEKEPGFFVPELWKNKNAADYEQLFAAAGNQKYCGESSTHYTKLPTYQGVSERIHQYNPEAKILYIVRHPVKRTISHYLHNRRTMHLHAESRTMLRAIEQDEVYTAYSQYSMQLGPYYEKFGRENIQVILFEEMTASPEKVLREIFAWLDVKPVLASEYNKKSNVAPLVAPTVRGFGLLNKLRHSSLWNQLSPVFPKKIRNLGNAMAERKEKADVHLGQVDEVHRKLRTMYMENVRELEALTGKSFDAWQF
jgi:hypothetical protein